MAGRHRGREPNARECRAERETGDEAERRLGEPRRAPVLELELEKNSEKVEKVGSLEEAVWK